jgi:DNA-binding response OmpR family regulator
MKKVLIIDDHRDLRELLRAQIGLKGFSAIGAKSAKEGIETAIAEKPDLILT